MQNNNGFISYSNNIPFPSSNIQMQRLSESGGVIPGTNTMVTATQMQTLSEYGGRVPGTDNIVSSSYMQSLNQYGGKFP